MILRAPVVRATSIKSRPSSPPGSVDDYHQDIYNITPTRVMMECKYSKLGDSCDPGYMDSYLHPSLSDSDHSVNYLVNTENFLPIQLHARKYRGPITGFRGLYCSEPEVFYSVVPKGGDINVCLS